MRPSTTTPFPLALASAALLLPLLAARPADACTCGDGSFVLPAFDAESVPVNTRVWVFRDGDTPRWIALVGPDGTIVPGQQSEMATTMQDPLRLQVFHPDAPLEPFTTYDARVLRAPVEEVIETCGEACVTSRDRDVIDACFGSCGELASDPHTFTTGALADTEAPPALEVLEHEVWERESDGDSCSAPIDRGARFRLGGAPDIVLVDREGEASLDDARLEGTVSIVSPDASVYVGNGVCMVSWTPPESGTESFRFRGLDLAGNIGPWTAPLEVGLEPEPAPEADAGPGASDPAHGNNPVHSGCAAAPGAIPGVLGGLLLALARRSRRRRPA